MEDPMDEPCDICGDVGYAELISICSQCSISREHVYCMRILITEVPEVWICEACLSTNGILSPKSGVKQDFMVHHDIMHLVGPSEVLDDSGRQGCFRRQKAKVKYLPTEEAIRLSSGATKKVSPLRGTLSLKPGPSNAIAPMSNRTSIKSKPVSPRLSPPRVKANPCLSPSGYVRPPRHGSGQISSMINQQAPQTVKGLKEPTALVTSAKENVSEPKAHVTPAKAYFCKEKAVAALTSAKKVETSNAMVEKASTKASCSSSTPVYCPPISSSEQEGLVAFAEEFVSKGQLMDALVPAKEVETSNTKLEKATNKAPCTSSPSSHFPHIINSGSDSRAIAEPKNSNAEDRNQLNVLSKLKLSLPCFPALDATWKGGFKIVDVSPSEIYTGIMAYPPSRVHPKAYEFSQKMPAILQVNLLPRFHLWADLFPDSCPDLNDIALYFFPGNFDRLKQAYASLLEHMEIQDAVMRSYIDGVELLIVTSKQLHVDSQNLIASSNSQYFLWGVFRHPKNEQNIYKMHEEHPALVSPLESAHDDHANMDDSAVMDMEIDMVGGVNVGNLDKAVSKKSSQRVCGSSIEEIGYQCSLQKLKGKSSTVSRDLDSTVQKNLLECKRLKHNDSDTSVGIAQKVESDLAIEHPMQNSSGKFSSAMDKMDIPLGFEEVLRPKFSGISCMATFTEEKPHLIGRRVMSSLKKENLGPNGISVVTGACSLQPQRPMEDSNLLKYHQKRAQDLAMNHMAAHRPPLPEKGKKCGWEMKAEGNYDEKLVEMGEKKLGYTDTPFPSKSSSQNSTSLSSGDKKRYNQFLPMEVKTEVKIEDFSRKLGTKPHARSMVTANNNFSEPSLSSLQYERGGCSELSPSQGFALSKKVTS